MIHRLAFFASTIALVTCGGTQTRDQASAGAVAADTPAVEQSTTPGARGGTSSQYPLGVDISTWSQWSKASSESFVSRSHQKAMVDVYVTPKNAEAYKALADPMPVGLALVKAQHKIEAGQKGAPMNLTVMVKMPAGFDPEHGDWYYGVYSYDGKKVMLEGKSDGKTEMCVDCHDTADTDHVFGSK